MRDARYDGRKSTRGGAGKREGRGTSSQEQLQAVYGFFLFDFHETHDMAAFDQPILYDKGTYIGQQFSMGPG